MVKTNPYSLNLDKFAVNLFTILCLGPGVPKQEKKEPLIQIWAHGNFCQLSFVFCQLLVNFCQLSFVLFIKVVTMSH